MDIEQENITYTDALKELEKIVKTLQSDNCDVDNMVALTRRATDLIALCRRRLTATDQQLKAALEALS